MDIQVLAEEALKKYYDKSFEDNNGNGLRHLWIRDTPSFFSYNDINKLWKSSWNVTVVGALVLSYIRVTNYDISGDGYLGAWWQDKFIEDKFRKFNIRDKGSWSEETNSLIRVNNQLCGIDHHADEDIKRLSKISNINMKVLRFIVKHKHMNPTIMAREIT